jgi:formylglycine-generating enzyme required for sulfatase activity
MLSCTREQGSLRRDNPFDNQGTNWYPPTVVMAPGDTSVSIFDTVTLSAIGTGKDTVVRYVWAKRDEIYADTTEIGLFPVAFPDSGLKIVLVKVLDRRSVVCLSPDTCIIEVTLDPPAVKMTPRDTTMSINDSVTLTAAGAGKHRVVEYLWAKNGNSFTDTTAAGVFRVTYPDSGKHLVLVKSVDTYGLLSKTDTCVARVTLDAPTVRMKMHDTTTNIRDTVALAAVGMGRHGIAGYIWAASGRAFSDTTTAGSFRVAYPDTGKHLAVVRSVDKYGLLSTPDTCIVSVGHTPPVLTHVNDTAVCYSATVAIHVTAVDYNKYGGIRKYYWDVGANGWDDSTDAPVHDFSNPAGGLTRIVWEARDYDGFTARDTFTIRFVRAPTNVSVSAPTAATSWSAFNYLTGKGTLPLVFSAIQTDLPSDTFVFTLLLGPAPDMILPEYSGGAARYDAVNIKSDATIFWRLVARNIFNDSTVSTGSVLAPPLPPPPGMRTIPGCVFQFGSDSPADNITPDSEAQPAHTVTLSSFCIDSTDVTQGDYLLTMGTNPSYFTGDLMRPVESVTWFDAVLYCNARSISAGLDTVYSYVSATGTPFTGCTGLVGLAIDLSKKGYRLPTEAEWEYASRGRTTTGYYWGDDSKDETFDQFAWYMVNSNGTTQPVARKKPNNYRLYDMSGNVWQWCNDWYGKYTAESQNNPQGASTGSNRVLRGGAYSYINSYDHHMRCACRYSDIPNLKKNDRGFRCVLR